MKKIMYLISFLMVQGTFFSAFGMDDNEGANQTLPLRAAVSVTQEEIEKRFEKFQRENQEVSEFLEFWGSLKLEAAKKLVEINQTTDENERIHRNHIYLQLDSALGATQPAHNLAQDLVKLSFDQYKMDLKGIDKKVQDVLETFSSLNKEVYIIIRPAELFSKLKVSQDNLAVVRAQFGLVEEEKKKLIQDLLGAQKLHLASQQQLLESREQLSGLERQLRAQETQPQMVAAAAAAGPQLALAIQSQPISILQVFSQQQAEQKPSGAACFTFVGANYVNSANPFPMDLLLMVHGSHRESFIRFCETGKYHPYSFSETIKAELNEERKLTQTILTILHNTEVALSTPLAKVFKEEKTPEERVCMAAIINFYRTLFSQRWVFLEKFKEASGNSALSSSFGKTIFLKGDASEREKENAEIDEMVETVRNLQDLMRDLLDIHLERTVSLDIKDYWGQSVSKIGKTLIEDYRSNDTKTLLCTITSSLTETSHRLLSSSQTPLEYLEAIAKKLLEKKVLKKGNLGKFFRSA